MVVHAEYKGSGVSGTCLSADPAPSTPRRGVTRLGEGVADLGEEGGDLALEEDHRDDDHHGDEGDDQRVLDQPLALGLVGDVQTTERLGELQHWNVLLNILHLCRTSADNMRGGWARLLRYLCRGGRVPPRHETLLGEGVADLG